MRKTGAQPPKNDISSLSSSPPTAPGQTSRTKKRVIFGKKRPSETSIAGQRIIPEYSVFVGGVSNEIDERGLEAYMKHEIKVQPLDITLNKQNRYNRSYKVTIKKDDKENVFNPDIWESNLIIQPYRYRRNHSTPYNQEAPKHFKSRWDP